MAVRGWDELLRAIGQVYRDRGGTDAGQRAVRAAQDLMRPLPGCWAEPGDGLPASYKVRTRAVEGDVTVYYVDPQGRLWANVFQLRRHMPQAPVRAFADLVRRMPGFRETPGDFLINDHLDAIGREQVDEFREAVVGLSGSPR